MAGRFNTLKVKNLEGIPERITLQDRMLRIEEWDGLKKQIIRASRNGKNSVEVPINYEGYILPRLKSGGFNVVKTNEEDDDLFQWYHISW